MRDPYDSLGIARGASFDEIKAAYRRACKSKHPDMGGSHDDFVELQNAYEYVLNDLKRGYQQQREAAQSGARAEQAHESAEAQTAHNWEKTYRDIDDELDELRRAARAHEDALRNMRARAWETGDRTTWAKLTWDNFARFVRDIARSGLKGLALLFAALIGVGSVFVDANVVSAIIVLGSGIGFFFSLALKNDKGGVMSAGMLLFGVMTIWLPPVRVALFLHPLTTISVLFCLGLIFKFAQGGGTVGLMTGGVLALYVIGVIIGDTQRQEQEITRPPPEVTIKPAPPTANVPTAVAPGSQRPAFSPTPPRVVPPQPLPPEPRTLLASNGAALKFVAGITYHLKVRTGFTTSLHASQGKVAFYSGDERIGECVHILELPMPASSTPYKEIDWTIRACGGDAVFRVTAIM